MKRLQIALVLASMSVGLVGCRSTDADRSAPPPVSQAAPAQQAKENVGGLACARCVCVKFEPLGEAPSVCRMCAHPASDHTRRQP